ncbi:MAG: hypothetical protein E3K37_03820 [Candidatus Kuenenia sp.]|nr:hypothetical protein [Candidatus Kuenenia hertensis]
MRFKIRMISITLLFFIFFVFCINYVYSGLKLKFQEIKIAYMNGYYEALHLNIETIKALQENEDLLKQVVNNAGEKYLKMVEDLNK